MFDKLKLIPNYIWWILLALVGALALVIGGDKINSFLLSRAEEQLDEKKKRLRAKRDKVLAEKTALDTKIVIEESHIEAERKITAERVDAIEDPEADTKEEAEQLFEEFESVYKRARHNDK